jgi:CheY-like chemotaxis protein
MMEILIVEDDAEIRNAYAYMLGQSGYQVVSVGTAEEAARALESYEPSVMLLDMLMPGLSGIEFLRQHHVHSRFPKMKILAFSNIDNPSIQKQAEELGAIEYLIKVQITPRQVAEKITQLIGPPSTNKK